MASVLTTKNLFGDGSEATAFKVVKREGHQVEYDRYKITVAVGKCLMNSCGESEKDSIIIGASVSEAVERVLISRMNGHREVTIETIQDLVETQLMAQGHHEAAKHYILYRDNRRRAREEEARNITPELKLKFTEGNQYFNGINPILQQIQAFDKFSRFRYEWGRREVWPESVDRVLSYFQWHANRKFPGVVPEEIWRELHQALLHLQASPSMRSIQMAGPALERCQMGSFNCSFLDLNSPTAFSEDLYILMQGTGVGFGVEDEYAVDKWPRVRRNTGYKTRFTVEDTTEGWCDAWKFGMETWMEGGDIEFDTSGIRKEGAPLKIKGGRASGSGPLIALLNFGRSTIFSRQNKRLTSLNLHDMACMTHRIVQMGGVRRASGISFSDLDDLLMRHAKRGSSWMNDHPHRNQANNSAVYQEKPTALDFAEEWVSIGRSGSGERGIFNAGSLPLQIPSRRKKVRLRSNPCAEVILRDCGLCNLSIAVIRSTDTKEEIRRKVVLATIWGTLQASMTDFLYVRKEWKENAEEEALLGVDLLGHLDHPLLRPDCPDKWEREQFLDELLQSVIGTNREWAFKFGINPTAAGTCGKPSGDSSVFFDTAAAFKAYHGKYYKRRLRFKANNPIAKVLEEAGVPHSVDYDKSGLLVFEIPARAPENAILLGDQTAIQQLENWLVYKTHWTEHNPSITVYVKDTEWLEVGNWIYQHWDQVGGLAFFPYDDSVYPQAPYETIDESTYHRLMANFPTSIDWSRIVMHEENDMTELSAQYACSGDKCEI